ncbi:MAG: glycosyltransferase family 4 protein [Planctomycetota bacterium]
MKVALLHKRFAPVGGTEGYVWELAHRLARRGEEVHVLCAEAQGSPGAGIRVRRLPVLRLGPTARMVSYALAADRLLRREPFDLVQGFGKTLRQDLFRLGGGCHAAYLERAHRPGSPGWIRTLAASSPHQRAALAIERRTFAPGNFRLLVTNSRMVREDLLRRFAVDPSRVRILYSGVDLRRFRPRPELRSPLRRELGVDEASFVLVYVGTGFGRKGLGALLRALPILHRQGLPARLLVVGRDARLAAHERLVRRLGLPEGSVLFRGGRAEVEREYAVGDLFVLPTLYDPFANATLEAMACGLPALTTDANGAAEVLEDGAGAILPSPASPEAIARAVLPLLDADRRRAAAARAREIAERFPREKHWEELDRLHAQVAGGKRGVPPIP